MTFTNVEIDGKSDIMVILPYGLSSARPDVI